MTAASRLCLGTVQFGLDYGVSNAAGRVPQDEVGRILAAARAAGADMLDTAELYGEAETALGRAGTEGFQVVGKIGALEVPPEAIAAEVRRRVTASLGRLGQARLYGLLLHRPAQLFDGPAQREAILDALAALKREGLVARVGFSAYGPEETATLAALADWDLVQLPFSPIDGRWQRSGVIAGLGARGIEIHLRSVFLQGLLLMPPDRRPAYFAPWADLLDAWQDWIRARGMTLVQGAAALALARARAARLVVGVTSVAEFEEIAAALADLPDTFAEDLTDAPVTEDEALLNPSLWRTAS